MKTINPLQFTITYFWKPQGLLRFLFHSPPLANRANTDRTKSNCAAVVTFLTGPPFRIVSVSVTFFILYLVWLLVFVKTFAAKYLRKVFSRTTTVVHLERKLPSKFVNLCYPLSDFSPTLSRSLSSSPYFILSLPSSRCVGVLFRLLNRLKSA